MPTNSAFWRDLECQLRALLVPGGDLTAVRCEDEGRWQFTGGGTDGHLIEEQFCALARRAAIADAGPGRQNALDLWLNRLAPGSGFAIEQVILKSAVLCAELTTRDLELPGTAEDSGTSARLRRDRYPFCCWLYSHAHEPASDPKAELEYWKPLIWRGYDALLGTYEQMGMASAVRHEYLDFAIGGLSYDLAVLQANYVVDRGLRGDEAMQTFRDESAALLEEVTSSWRASCERMAVSFEDGTEELKNLAQPFHRVRDDLRRLLAELPAGRPPTTESPSIGPAKTYKTDFGRNVDRLRKECGWSFDELAGKTGMDKKLILGHVNDGKGARPNTVKTYAEAFTKKLNRNVSVAELES